MGLILKFPHQKLVSPLQIFLGSLSQTLFLMAYTILSHYPANNSVIRRRSRRRKAYVNWRRNIGNPRQPDRSPGFFARRQTVGRRQNRQCSDTSTDMISLRRSAGRKSTEVRWRKSPSEQRRCSNEIPPLTIRH